MKKIIAIVLTLMLVLSLGSFTTLMAEEEAEDERFPGHDVYALTEDAAIGFWLASVSQSGGGWVTYSEDSYVAATFTAAKPFSAIAIPFWSGDPNAFAGITPTEVEFALFKAVEGNYGSDYKVEDAVVSMVKTCDHDEIDFVWEFDEQPEGRYCLRVSQLTEEGGYIVIAQGDPVDDDAEFDIENAMQNTLMKDGVALTIVYGGAIDHPEPTEAPATPTPIPADELYYLYDKNVGVNTGWWLHPIVEDSAITVTFDVDCWFSGFNYFAYCCDISVPMVIVLADEEENELWTGDATCVGNAGYTVDMGKSFAPGTYTLSFIGGDVSEIESDTWFVLGSGQLNEDLGEEYVTIAGGLTNDSTGPAPFISLIRGEAGPDVTEAPATDAPVVTDVPATDVPATDVPATDAPATEAPATEAETTKPTEANKDNTADDKKGGLPLGAIIGIAVAAVAVIAVAAILIAKAAKKKK